MKNTFGTHVCVTLFGESHGPYIGAVLDGLAPGVAVNEDSVRRALARRAPRTDEDTPRREPDDFRFISGVKDGFTTGTPLTVLIPNTDTDSAAYEAFGNLPRPGHADYTAECKYHGFQDARGGGHFSGRITAALVAVGAVCRDALAQKGITLATRLCALGGVEDAPVTDWENTLPALAAKDFPVADDEAGRRMKAALAEARRQGNSVGGITETAVLGLPAGVGEPWFDTVEGVLSHALFSVPAVKGVAFGDGFALANMTGSAANDPLQGEKGEITHLSNHNGGVIGGITNGMPLVFRCVFKPAPSIGLPQKTVNTKTGENTVITVNGRHDAAVAPRGAAVLDAVTAITLCDLLAGRFGTDWLRG